MNLESLQKLENFLIYGYGVEGKSSFEFLKKKYPNKNIEIYDENISIKKNKKTLELEDYDVIVVSPGIARKKFSNKIKEKITSQVELFFGSLSESKRKKVIGISGTKGKSTTTKFCAEMIEKAGEKVSIGGNFGVPFFEIYDDFVNNKIKFVLAELSSFQLENLKISPGIAIFLNIFPEHIDRHGDYESYIEAKKNLWRYQKLDDVIITPKKIEPFVKDSKPNNIYASKNMSAEYFPNGSVFRAQHFLENFGTVLELAKILNISKEDIKETAKNFVGLPHRLEFVIKKKGISFYNDSISTNPNSSYSAIRFFGEKLGSIILGGKDRGIEYDLSVRGIQKFAPKAFIIVLDTETRPKIEKALKGEENIAYAIARDLKEAVKIGYEKTSAGKTCVLSPAASSFDRFKNYIERGNLFKKYVKDY